jgi:branched-chain amino acid transport system permease protein
MAIPVQTIRPEGATRRAFDRVSGRPGAWLAALLVALALLPLLAGSQSFMLQILMSIFLFAVLGQAWNLTAGYAGLLNFGQQAFIGLGGFSLALVYYYAHVPIWLAWPVAGLTPLVLAGLLCLPIKARKSRRRVWIGIGIAVLFWIGYECLIAIEPAADVFQSAYVRRASLLLLIFLSALPVLRLRGPYFAIATWLIAEAIGSLFNGWNVTGAGNGMQIKSEVTQLQLYYVALLLLIATTAFIWLWMRSTQGLALTAIRDEEDAAQSCGVDVNKVKALVFISSAAMTGLAAGLYFIDVVIITPTSGFTISWAAYIVFIVVSGGMGTVAGPIIGAILFILVERVLGAAAGQGMLLLGVLSILLMLLLPRGIMGLLGDMYQVLGTSPRSPAGVAAERQIA